MADEQPQGNGQGAAQQGEPPKQQFQIAKLYLKDVSLETPNSPEVFTGEWKPQINVDLSSKTRALQEGHYEVALTVTVTAKQGENTAYLCEVTQAGVFQIKGFEDAARNGLLGAYCPAQLFPYVRETVNSLVTQGGFPAMVLQPVNFDALYQQRLAQAAERQKAGEAQGGGAEAPPAGEGGDATQAKGPETQQ